MLHRRRHTILPKYKYENELHTRSRRSTQSVGSRPTKSSTKYANPQPSFFLPSSGSSGSHMRYQPYRKTAWVPAIEQGIIVREGQQPIELELLGVRSSENLQKYTSPADLSLPPLQDPPVSIPGAPVIPESEQELGLRVLTFAESVCETVEAEETSIHKRIMEGENYLSILRLRADDVANKLKEAQRQLIEARKAYPLVKTDAMLAVDKARHRAVEVALFESLYDEWDEEKEDQTSSKDGESGVGSESEGEEAGRG